MSRLSPPLRRSERHFALIRVATALVLLLLASPLAAVGQVPEKIARTEMVRSETRPLDDRIKRNIADVRARLQDEGYTEGQHYRIAYYTPTRQADITQLARMLVRDRVDVIHAIAHVAIEAGRASFSRHRRMKGSMSSVTSVADPTL